MLLRPRLILACSALALGGCGAKGIAPVSGQVKLNGKPVAGIAVSLQPVVAEGNIAAGPASYGVTDAEGKYVAQVLGESTKGAAVGKNQVRFSVYMPPDDPDKPSKVTPSVQIPARYWSDPKIELDVPPGGTSSANFELTSP